MWRRAKESVGIVKTTNCVCRFKWKRSRKSGLSRFRGFEENCFARPRRGDTQPAIQIKACVFEQMNQVVDVFPKETFEESWFNAPCGSSSGFDNKKPSWFQDLQDFRC